MPLRHSVLWTLRDSTTAEQRSEMLRGLAFLCMECRDVQAGDYGDDLFGGNQPLRDVPPWKRTPRWRSPGRPPANYDMALHLDFDDWPSHDAYGADPIHNAASAFNEAVSWDELTARVDWWTDDAGLPSHQIRHVAMFLWADDVSEPARAAALDAFRALDAAPGVAAVSTGINVGHLTTDFDWIVDVSLTDPEAAGAFLESEPYADAMRTASAVTKPEWTARVTHRVRARPLDGNPGVR